MGEDELKAKPVGTGPYKYENITATEVTAVPNEYYNGNEPAKPDPQVAVLKDALPVWPPPLAVRRTWRPSPRPPRTQLKAAGWNVESKPGYGNPFLMFNTQKAPFDKPEVRRAFLRAINRQALIDTALDGQAVPATSFLPEANPLLQEALDGSVLRQGRGRQAPV